MTQEVGTTQPIVRPLTSQMLRRVSADAILAVLRRGDVMTATDLMEATGLSRTSVHEVCSDLLRLHWIGEVDVPAGDGPSGPGRRPRRYAFDGNAGRVLGIDLGVHTFTVCVSDLRGRVLVEVQQSVVDPDTGDRSQVLERMVDEAMVRAGVTAQDVLAVGVGVPSSVSAVDEIRYPPEQRGAELGRDLGVRHGWPVLIENDANLAALGERWCGAATGLDNFVVLLAGERLGAGIYMDGRLARGHRGSAGELRFVSLMPSVQQEVLGIARHARLLGAAAVADGAATPTLRAMVDGDAAAVTAKTVFDAAAAGDASAAAIVTTVCERLAQLVAVLATLLDPERVVIAGGIADAGDLLATTTRSLLPSAMIDNPPQISASTLGRDGVVIGGIRLALDHLEAHLLDGMTLG